MKSRALAVVVLAFGSVLQPALSGAAPIDPAPELALCRGKPLHMAALSRISTQARAAPEGQRLTVQLSPDKTVSLPGTSPDFEKARAKTKGATYAGLVRLVVTRPGTYRVGVAQDAWVDIATATGKLLDAGPDEGTFTCDGAQKVLLYRLTAADTYWLQIALFPRRETMLTIVRGD